MFTIAALTLLITQPNIAQSAPKWSWNDTRDYLVTTTKSISDKRMPILRVRHKANVGAWTFDSDSSLLNEIPVALPKSEIIELDPTIRNVLDLPLGWEAIRKNKDSRWVRRRIQ